MKKIELGRGVCARVDDDDLQWLSQWNWTALRRNGGGCGFYAKRHDSETAKTFLMHRELLGLKAGDRSQVDHVNRDGLDNRRSNLRVVTSSQNKWNRSKGPRGTSRFKGVYKHSTCDKWVAEINKRYLGLFESEEQAAMAYDSAAVSEFGEYAATNKAMGLL